MAGRRVLVTGVAGQIGGLVAASLARHVDVDHVVGVDSAAPTTEAVAAAGVELVRVDLRSPSVVRLVRELEVDTVVHMGVVLSAADAGGRASMKEINILGTMHLLAACQKLDTVRRVVVRSSAGVYGSGPEDPALFAEDTEPTHPPRSGWGRDCIEVEATVRGFARRRRDITVAMLRFTHAVAPSLRTQFTDLFLLPMVPAPLGRDARLQFVHVDDIVEASVTAALTDASGEINIAGPGVLTVTQAATMAGRPVMGLPGAALRRLHRLPAPLRGVVLTDDDISLLGYGRVLDTTRMTRDLGFAPRFGTTAAFADFVTGRQASGPLGAARDSIVAAGRVLTGTR